MGKHSVPRGEESTYAGNGGKQNPIHQGKHRAKDTGPRLAPYIQGEALGTRKDANPKYTKGND